MRAIVVRQLGGIEHLVLEDVPEPVAGPGQVAVRVRAVGVNFSESERRRGVYRPPVLPWIPGGEGAGEVVAVGPGVDPAWLSRRVAFWELDLAPSGSYAETAIVPAAALVEIPDGVAFESAAGLLLQGLTATGVTRLAARITPGETVLIHAAAGGVGLLAVQLARRAGARVLGTASTPEKRSLIAELGGEPFAYGDGLPGRVAEATRGRGVDVVLDSVGRATRAASFACLAPFGRLIWFGEASGPVDPVDPGELYDRSLSIGAYVLNAPHPEGFLDRARRDLMADLAAGSLRVTIGAVLPLAAASEAHRLLESRQSAGKLILRV